MTEREALELALEALELALEALEANLGNWGAKTKAIPAIQEALAQPEQEQIQPDKVCIEDDGCPTEKAVLQRFWREHQKTQQQEPVGEVSKAEFGDYPVICWRKGYVAKIGDKFYTTPPQRTWVGLRDSQKLAIIRDCSHLSMTQLIELVEEEIRRNNNA